MQHSAAENHLLCFGLPINTMATAKKSAKKSTGKGPACWPGFTRVPGTKAGTKGSCKKKARTTSSERRADSKAAAASKREKHAD